MNHILLWNCRGLGSIPAVNALRRVVINEHPMMIFLQETKLKKGEMEHIRRKLKFKCMIAVDCEGEARSRRGGLALLWKEEWAVEICSYSMHHIDAMIRNVSMDEWRFTGVYGWPEESNKYQTGNLLKALSNDSMGPWVCGGDFNVMLWSTEKRGGSVFKFEDAAMFREALDSGGLEDLQYVGHPYTWTNNQGGEKNIQERLDRCLANAQWKEHFRGSFVTHLEKRRSDHLPLLLCLRTRLETPQKKRKKRLFRFEEMWLREESCEEIIREAWNGGWDMASRLNCTTSKLKEWSAEKFGDFAKQMRSCKAQMGHLMSEEQTPEVIAQMQAIDRRMDELENREEIYWKQRSRQEWLRHGDNNSKFFHAKAKQRTTRNTIDRIRDEAGNEFEDENEIAEILVQHFDELFTANAEIDTAPVVNIVEEKVPPNLKSMLAEPYTHVEVREALKQMHPTKAPGPDGMCALFYQKFWDIVGGDVEHKILDILNNGGDVSCLNRTHIALIPKKKICETPIDFRPISLCNVLYKLVSKVLANRLKRVLPIIIHESQSGFVPGRLITDNILVAYECFHYLRKKKKGKEGFLGLKLDMSKAYDRVEWSFLEQMMLKLGFPGSFVTLIINCIKSASFSILVNGQPSRTFVPTRGLRQGDPLSPFLFIICAEGLSTLLRDAEAKKEIHGLKIGKKVDAISHLFFADDSLLFTRANEEEVDKVLDILSIYEAASGQKLNMEKSEVSFSRNIAPEKQEILQMKLTFKAVEEHEKYLGLPTFVGGSKKRVFQGIRERILKKLKGWKEGFLSQAGREVLIKAVAQAIPTYAMQCFNLPVSLLNEIEKLCRNFFWGQQHNEKKVAWVSWEKICRSKKEGGLGMRNLVVFNKAMLAKQAWRVLKFPHSLMAKVLKNKYFPHTSFMDVRVSPLASYTWKSILSARQLLERGVRKVVGNGAAIVLWSDPWIPTLPNFRVLKRVQPEGGPRMVNEVIVEGKWDKAELRKYLTQWEIGEILKIPIPITSPSDKWMWHYTKSGDFSVRSAYFVELERRKNEHASSSRSREHSVWKELWHTKVPAKVRNFGWKALHQGLPMRAELAKRGCEIDKMCPLCGEQEETVKHIMMSCPDTQTIWRLSPLRLIPNADGEGSFTEWVAELLVKVKDERWWALFWCVAWGVWLRRNVWVFESRRVELEGVVDRAVRLMCEYELAMEVHKPLLSDVAAGAKVWEAPAMGRLKINSDAAMFDDGKVGIGGVVRDAEGDVLMATCVVMEGGGEVDIAEGLAARHSLQVALDAGFRCVILESDNLKLISHLISGKEENNSFGFIISDILWLCMSFLSISFSHVCREGNRVAHKLAHISKNFNGMRVWLEEVPDEVLADVNSDLISLMK